MKFEFDETLPPEEIMRMIAVVDLVDELGKFIHGLGEGRGPSLPALLTLYQVILDDLPKDLQPDVMQACEKTAEYLRPMFAKAFAEQKAEDLRRS